MVKSQNLWGFSADRFYGRARCVKLGEKNALGGSIHGHSGRVTNDFTTNSLQTSWVATDPGVKERRAGTGLPFSQRWGCSLRLHYLRT